MIKVNLIVAMDRNRNIGFNDDMPWGKEMKADLKRFKDLTTGKAVVMGRKTYETIGKPLPNRLNIVMTRNPKWNRPELWVPLKQPGQMYSRWNEENGSLDLVSDWEEKPYQCIAMAPQVAANMAGLFKHDEIFVIGGAQIYEEFMPYADKIYLTKVCAHLEGDTKFPSLMGSWKIEQEPVVHQEGDKYPSQYITYTRRSSDEG
jgi:dihydrofolate reductase